MDRSSPFSTEKPRRQVYNKHSDQLELKREVKEILFFFLSQRVIDSINTTLSIHI
jgi:hypothetical protein